MRLSFFRLQPVHLLLVSSFALFAFSGCAGGKRVITSYPGGMGTSPSGQAETARQRQAVFTRDSLNPALAWVNKRVEAYGEKTTAWQQLSSRTAVLHLPPRRIEQLSSCRRQSTNLLAGYNRLQDQLLADQDEQRLRWLLSHSLAELKQKDISYLDGNCQQLMAALKRSYESRQASSLASVESNMQAAFDRNDYEAVIGEYQSLPLALGEEPGYGINFIYGRALLKTGRVQDARMVLSELVDQADQQGRMRLLELLGDLDFGLGDYSSAHRYYEEYNRMSMAQSGGVLRIHQKLAALQASSMHRTAIENYGALLLSLLTNNPQRDGFTLVQQAWAYQQRYPDSPLRPLVREIAGKASTEAKKWFGALLARTDQLVQQGEKQQALQMLREIPLNILPLDKQAILRLKIESLSVPVPVPEEVEGEGNENAPVIEEEVLQTTEPSQPDVTDDTPTSSPGYVPVTKLQETWNQGMADMQAKEYDSAIMVFTGLLNTSMGHRARVQIEEARHLAAHEKRKKAAELFVRSNRATDPQARRELLLSSKQLLEDILQKYPQAGLGVKVRRNIDRIDRELNSMERGNTPEPPEGNVQGKDKVGNSQWDASTAQ